MSVRFVRHAFGKRHRLSSTTRKDRTFDKVVKKAMFAIDDKIMLLKDKITMMKSV